MRAQPTFLIREFGRLTPHQLHDLLRLRIDVFVVEQRCAYPEIDGRDPEATHLLGLLGESLVACARWYRLDDIVILGRIATRADLRRRGVGRALVLEALRVIGDREVRISAQQPLEAYYRRFGFRRISGPYDDFGIPHLDMVRDSRTR